MAKLAEPLMKDGGVLVTMSYYGADKVVNRYNMMGPVKASLEAVGPLHGRRTRLARRAGVRRVSRARSRPAPASGISHFDELVQMAQERAPAQRLVDIAEVGRVVAFLVGGASSGMTGDTIYVDGGLHNMA